LGQVIAFLQIAKNMKAKKRNRRYSSQTDSGPAAPKTDTVTEQLINQNIADPTYSGLEGGYLSN
jgi:hypothetical protein